METRRGEFTDTGVITNSLRVAIVNSDNIFVLVNAANAINKTNLQEINALSKTIYTGNRYSRFPRVIDLMGKLFMIVLKLSFTLHETHVDHTKKENGISG